MERSSYNDISQIDLLVEIMRYDHVYQLSVHTWWFIAALRTEAKVLIDHGALHFFVNKYEI